MQLNIQQCVLGPRITEHWKSNPLVSVAVRQPEVAETAAEPPQQPLQKHLLGGCTTDMPPSNSHRRGAYRFAIRAAATVTVEQIICVAFLRFYRFTFYFNFHYKLQV